jgi:hypothetical protein
MLNLKHLNISVRTAIFILIYYMAAGLHPEQSCNLELSYECFVGKDGHNASIPSNCLLFMQSSALHHNYNVTWLLIYTTTDK